MRVRDILRSEEDVPRIDLLGVLSSVLSLSTEKVIIQSERELSGDEENQLHYLLEERRRRRPMAHLTGTKEFFSRSFMVDQRVLIPRPETEILVEEALRIIRARSERIGPIADVGTGSGAIGITLAKESGKRVTCVDISQEALQLARVNAIRLEAIGLVNIVCSDLLSGFGDRARFDLIVANLPYVSEEEWQALMPDVRLFEPRLALWGGTDGLDIYRRFIAEAKGHLSKDGHILCEIGSPGQAEALSILFNGMGLSAATIEDLSGRERVVVGSCKSSS
ncbi:MAG TPA: peptide chain release factor N(5)-glutamine methyltransferase [Deltaproteobacteria bacterium]|nr:peptide chain release factor N(5)-glutamine methyltransferase [Deltaproteobacteria bacterium]